MNFAEVVNSSQGTYIQAGMFMGNLGVDGCPADTPVVQFFWLDKRPNSAEYCHVDGSGPSFGTYYGTTIFQESSGGSTWAVGVGPWYGKSTDSLTSENYIEVSTFTNASGSQLDACDYARGLAWYDGYGHLHDGWHDTYGDAVIEQTEPPYAYFHDSPLSPDYPSWFRAYSPASNSNCF